MINLAGIMLVMLAVLVYVQVIFLLVEVLASFPPIGVTGKALGQRRAPVAILIPAHNESVCIVKTVAALKSQLTAHDRLIVIADNCSDDTASLAIVAGAEVVERHDHERSGKGYALDYGIEFLRRSGAREVVIFVDADCTLAAGSVDELAQLSVDHYRPVQATNLMESAGSAGRTVRIAQFAWRVKNYVRPLGAWRLGLPCYLTGTGMAFPWSIIGSVELSTGHIAEDAKLGYDLAISGHEPLFCPGARVSSYFPLNASAARHQRTRWEHGHLTIACQYVPRLLWSACLNRRVSLVAMALDLSIPPLGLLTLLMIALLGGSVLMALAGFPAWPIVITASALLTFGLALSLAWYRHAREIVSARDLLFAPTYALSKIPTLWRFLIKRQMAWIKTERDPN
jgi:cellulose synthase/poly-beta-1,6-N-acetylglucosamine synthase-like glycosyltransferase